MTNKRLTIDYIEYSSVDELAQPYRSLAQNAIEAAQGSYAPYSKFNVGAAVLLGGGQVVKGANQENAAYPSGICAERTALFYAGAAYPDERVEAIAITAKKDGQLTERLTYPCGACRQVMAECEMRAGAPIKIFIISAKAVLEFSGIASLMPFVFDNLNN